MRVFRYNPRNFSSYRRIAMSSTSRSALLPHEWRASTSLAGVYALRMLGMFLVLPVLALYAAEMGGSKADGGLAIAAYGLTQALLQLPLGIASDRFGRKKIIYLGLLVFAAGSFIAALADSITWLIIGRAIQGAGAVSAAVTALLADLTREEVRTRAMASVGLTIGLTFAVSMVLSPVLSRYIGVDGLFALTGILSLAAIAVVAFITPNPTQSKLREDADTQPSRISEVLGNGQLMRLNFGILALQAVMMAIFASLPHVLEQLNMPRANQWQIYLPAVLLGLILMIPAIIIGETRNQLKTVFVAGISLILAALCGLFAGMHSLLAIGVALVIYFIGFNILEASLPSIVSKIAPGNLKGTAMGVYNTAQSLGVFIGGAAGGRLYEHFGFGGVFTFGVVFTGVWLLIAATAKPPAAVKNLMLPLPAHWQNATGQLAAQLQNINGISAVHFSADGQTLYLKIPQKGFDESVIGQILATESPNHAQ